MSRFDDEMVWLRDIREGLDRVARNQRVLVAARLIEQDQAPDWLTAIRTARSLQERQSVTPRLADAQGKEGE